MDRSLILPLSIAAALHAGVLFGFHRGDVPVVKRVAASYIRIAMPPPQEDPPDEVTATEEKSKSTPADLVPRSPEPPVTPSPTDITVKMVPEVNVTAHVADMVNLDFTPVPDGGGGTEILPAGFLDNAPRARVQIPPPYPADARQRGMDGKVLVEFIVDESGHVLNPHIVDSTNPAFDETTLRTIVKWRFEPGKKNGRAVRFRMALPLEFNLNEN